MPASTPLLVVGVGDASRGDDGLGAATVALLRERYAIPAGVELADGAVPTDAAAPRAAVVVGAVHADHPPGAFVRLAGDEATSSPAHRLLGRVPDGALDAGQVIVVGLVPESTATRAGLSPAVAAGLAGLVRHVVLEARQLGHELQPLRGPDARRPARGEV
jgi:hydrogenase maturation protease